MIRALWELSKPGVTRLVLVTTAVGGAVAPGPVPWAQLGPVVLGTALVVAAANALNMVIEREGDALMERTRGRPLPTGRIGVAGATLFAVVVGVAGLAVTLHWGGRVATLVSAAALLSYVGIYTPLKRVTPLALHVGAVPGALPPVIGWAAVTGHVGAGAVALFALMWAWQLPHFLAIAIFRRQEYARAGVKVLPAVRGVFATKIEIIVTTVIMVAASLVPVLVGLAPGPVYLTVALLGGLGFFVFSLQGLEDEAGDRWARGLFFASMPYLVVLMTVLVIAAG